MTLGVVPSYGGPLNTHLAYRRNWLGESSILVQHHLAEFRRGNVSGLPIQVDSADDVAMVMADIAESHGAFQLCRTQADLEAASANGAIGLFLTPSFAAVGSQLERLRMYKALGAVLFPMSLNNRNALADGCGERGASGLSHLGVAAVRMMNELGIVVDVSHLSHQAFWDTIEVSSQSVIASHSGARALCNNPRNLSDDQAKAIAERGGCVGVSVHPSLLSTGAPSVDDYVAHILHFVELVGDDHVSMGADFIDYQIEFLLPKLRASAKQGIYHDTHVMVPGLSGFGDLAGVPDLLRTRGVDDAAVDRISFRNFLTVVDRVGTYQPLLAGGRAA